MDKDTEGKYMNVTTVSYQTQATKYEGIDLTDPKFKGCKRDDRLKDGPIEDRSCTDMFCCLLFIVFWAGFGYITYYGLQNGDPLQIASVFDADSNFSHLLTNLQDNQCGKTKGFEKYKYLYYTTPSTSTSYLKRTVCVSNCPNWTATSTVPTALKCKPNSVVKSCKQSSLPLESSVMIYQSTLYVGHVCMPSVSKYQTMFAKFLNLSGFQADLYDLIDTWQLLVISVFVAFFLGMVWICLLKRCTGLIVWICILSYFAGISYLDYESYYMYKQYRAREKNGYIAKGYTDSATTWKWIFYILTTVLGISVLALFCLYKSISVSIKIMKVASNFVRDVKRAQLVPIINYILLCTVIVLWTYSIAFVYTTGTLQHTKGSIYPFGTMKLTRMQFWFMWYQLFGFLWGIAFVHALGEFVLASSVCIWYFAPKQKPTAPVCKSLCRAFYYHLGSLAFGSLLIAIFNMIKAIFAYINKQLSGELGVMGQNIKKCVACCLQCFTRFLRYLNKHAYIEIALTGNSFCIAAKDSFFLMLNNPARFGLIEFFGSFVMFTGKAFISLLNVGWCYYVLVYVPKYAKEVTEPLFPLAIILITTYSIAHNFMTVYEMATYAILHCFCLDEQLHGEGKANTNTPKELHAFMEEHEHN